VGLTVPSSIVPSEDAHGSEYVAEGDKRREFISGFVIVGRHSHSLLNSHAGSQDLREPQSSPWMMHTLSLIPDTGAKLRNNLTTTGSLSELEVQGMFVTG
jgi:hypothetical protein